MKTLRVRPVGEVMVQDYAAMRSGLRRYVGRRLDPTQGETWIDPVTQLQHRQAVFVPLEEPEEVPNLPEFRKAVLAGDLEPADAETARACGVPLKTQE
jgi:hypothetical protein